MLWRAEEYVVYCVCGVDGVAGACCEWGVFVGVFHAEGEGELMRDDGGGTRGGGGVESERWRIGESGKGS